ncbi:MAG: MgtC/SapB family protein [Methylobacteriaceae bacterium]|nr:MgtC/SapB family protein [Methylobacteriaceae bacterium]MBV9219772.1 MgtC/SapB family protein [Methylobacteriaceae bacterium]MBV9634333.1 MgtC/SapB family protein [Methylobacteriaceae bacterium]MBV9705215.1 MgtC/SapB family protein [Methylobacteriaceae bacterium]
MSVAIEQAVLSLATAVGLGAAIGFERQWRHRLAGLRTNTLVSLGAASFVLFSLLGPGESSPTRVAAQVVSGIGFLGAGVIFKEGLSVRGLNTAATLWCSSAVGVLAGGGYYLYAALSAAFVVAVNLLLRPLVNAINRQPLESAEVETTYLVTVICRGAEEAHVRALLLQGFSTGDLHLHELDSSNIEDTDRVEVTAKLTSDKRREISLEYIVGRLSLEASVTAARWQSLTTMS